MNGKSNCAYCAHYLYDDYNDCYVCERALDEDEMARFLQSAYADCPYFAFQDEYKLVRKQN